MCHSSPPRLEFVILPTPEVPGRLVFVRLVISEVSGLLTVLGGVVRRNSQIADKVSQLGDISSKMGLNSVRSAGIIHSTASAWFSQRPLTQPTCANVNQTRARQLSKITVDRRAFSRCLFGGKAVERAETPGGRRGSERLWNGQGTGQAVWQALGPFDGSARPSAHPPRQGTLP